MARIDLFAYLAAFVSIVLAVALTDMIQSAHRLLRARHRVKWDPLAPLLAVSVFVLLLWQFFGLWGDARFDRLTFNGLVALVMVPTIYTLAAFAVLPDEVQEQGLDLRQFYFDNRRYVATLLALGTLGDMVRSIRFGATHDVLDKSFFWEMFALSFGGASIALLLIYFARRWGLQLLAVIGFLLVTYIPSAQSYIEPLRN